MLRPRGPVALAALACVALIVAPAAGKQFASIVLVGADGRSLELRPGRAVIDRFFSGSVAAQPAGGYVRVYPLDPSGHVGIPGRFYPATGALCLSWDQAAAPRACRRPDREVLAVLEAAGKLREFRGSGTTLAELIGFRVPHGVTGNLRVAVELAFDRARLARRAPPPRGCIRFLARWRGPGAPFRPRAFCLSRRGVYADAVLRPLGVAPWSLARANRLDWCPRCSPLRSIERAGVSAVYPRAWHAVTIDRHITNPVLRFQLSTEPGADGASVAPKAVVIRVQEVVPPLLTRRGLELFPPRPRRVRLDSFDRLVSWPRGRGTQFRAHRRAFSVWVAFGAGATQATRERVAAVLDSIRIGERR